MMKKIVAWCLSVLMMVPVAAGITFVSAEADTGTPVLLLEGERLKHDRDRYKWGAQQMTSEYDSETGIVRWTATGHDPYCHLLTKNTAVGPIVAVKYRTDNPVNAKVYAAGVDLGDSGVDWADEGNSFEFAYISDGEWHLRVLNLEEYLPMGAYNAETNVLDHFRLDFVDGAYEGEWVEVEYVAFFNSEADAEKYDRIRSGEFEDNETEDASGTESEAAGETATTKAEETTAADTGTTVGMSGGCGSVVGSVGACVLLSVVAAAVVVKKKD
jgi:hypothetical protein